VAGRIRRLWRRSLWGKLGVLASFGFVALVAATAIGVKLTEGNRFCGYACHEMIPYATSWEVSKHSNVDCVKCHIPPGIGNLAIAKIRGLHEVKVHLFGPIPNPIQSTRPVENSVCQGCHDAAQLAKPVQLVTATFNHSTHGAPKVPYCDDCHAQVVHTSIPGVTSVPPQSMDSCFTCHDGKAQPNECAYCHKAPHPNRGACQDCHNLKSWVPGNFHHPVPLTGPHAALLCEQCHTSSTGGTMGPADGCVNCHGDHHNSKLLLACGTCHTTTHFTPSTFVHKQVGPHVPSGDQPLQCSDCHTQTLATATCSCHGGKPPTGGG
jgi:nitrate/TMAO reductase-like tetraheme cytochrome c subunit